jgi:hypothetical protein
MDIKKEVKALKALQRELDITEKNIRIHYESIIREPLRKAKTMQDIKDIKRLLHSMPDIIDKDMILAMLGRVAKEMICKANGWDSGTKKLRYSHHQGTYVEVEE